MAEIKAERSVNTVF